jgi:hypothetical protein
MAVKVITPNDMRDVTQDRVDCVINKFQAVLRNEPKGLEYYCIRIPEPTEYSSLMAAKIEAAYRQVGWGNCRCGRYWTDDCSDYVQLQLWVPDVS